MTEKCKGKNRIQPVSLGSQSKKRGWLRCFVVLCSFDLFKCGKKITGMCRQPGSDHAVLELLFIKPLHQTWMNINIIHIFIK